MRNPSVRRSSVSHVHLPIRQLLLVVALITVLSCGSEDKNRPTRAGLKADPCAARERAPLPQEQELLERINAVRRTGADCGRTGLLGVAPPLLVATDLVCAARAQAEDMGARGFFSHVNPDGLDARARAARAGFAGQVGENLAWGQVTPEEVVDEWSKSPIHCKTMLWSAFSSVGIGYYRTAAGRTLWAAVFGTRTSAP
jgi:uncharacterized protein YkwD